METRAPRARAQGEGKVAPRLPLGGREPWLVFAVALAAYTWLGWLGAYVIRTYNADGLARIGQAFTAIFGRQPHLAAIGFIWGPLPVVSEIPAVFLLRPLSLVLMAGPLMSAFYGAAALGLCAVVLRRFGVPAGWRVIWLLLFGLHPLVVHNAAMGLSEAPFLACLLASLLGFVVWEQDGQPMGLLAAGGGAALALWCRYDGIAWIAASCVGIAAVCAARRPPQWRASLESSVLTLVTPPVWALGFWVLLNWQVMGNPIHFLVGPGSTATTPDTARLVGAGHPFATAHGSLGGAAQLVVRQIVLVGPLLLPATAAAVALALWPLSPFWPERESDRTVGVAYLALAWSIVGFTGLTGLQGLLPPFTRYFFWIVPAGLLAAATVVRSLPPGALRHAACAGAALLLLLPVVRLSARAIETLPEPAPLNLAAALLHPPEVQDVSAARGQLAEYEDMGRFLDAQPPGTIALIDAAGGGSSLLLFTRRPQDVVTTPDEDFSALLRAPVGHVDLIFVPRPTFDALGRSDVLRAHPLLYERGATWARLEREFTGGREWRAYRVLRS